MKHRGPKDWNRDPAPLGTIALRKTKGRDGIRVIKVTYRGPAQNHWKPLARHWWEKNKGPVPPGMRVVHLNGDTLDDRPENYGLMTGGHVALLYRRTRKGVQEKMEKRRAVATAEANRLRSLVNRATSWLPTRWYPVDRARRIIFNHPRRQRHQVLQLCGIAIDAQNWRWARRLMRESECPFEAIRGSSLSSPEFSSFIKTDALPGQYEIRPIGRERLDISEAFSRLAEAVRTGVPIDEEAA